MKMMDCVEVTVEKKSYAQDGVHIGMQGWICLEQRVEGFWLVNFPQCGEKDDIAEISLKEEDLKLIPVMHAIKNEQIKAQFDEAAKKITPAQDKAAVDKSEDIDISDYMV